MISKVPHKLPPPWFSCFHSLSQWSEERALLRTWKVESKSLSIMSDWILQARILERVAFPFSRGSSQPRVWTQVSCIAGKFFIVWAAGKPALSQRSCFIDAILEMYSPMVNSGHAYSRNVTFSTGAKWDGFPPAPFTRRIRTNRKEWLGKWWVMNEWTE